MKLSKGRRNAVVIVYLLMMCVIGFFFGMGYFMSDNLLHYKRFVFVMLFMYPIAFFGFPHISHIRAEDTWTGEKLDYQCHIVFKYFVCVLFSVCAILLSSVAIPFLIMKFVALIEWASSGIFG